MTFRRGARLNPGQVRDMRGRSGSGGGTGGFNLPGGFGPSGGGRSGGGGGLPVGGSIGSLVLIVIVIIVLYFLTNGLGGGSPSGAPGTGDNSNLEQECVTGEDANERLDCRIVGFVNSVQAYWEDEFASRGETYQQAQTTLFTDSIQTGCGHATSQTGPFYCPADQNIYLDLGFFEVLETQYGASGGPLAQAYVIAHEYGHHVQGLDGTLARAQDGDTGPQSAGVRVELQADCYAGSWAANAVDTEYLEPLTETEVQQALSAAAAVGDDRLQEAATGRVNPEQWTHGSAEQRQQWFSIGYREGESESCDTFSVPTL